MTLDFLSASARQAAVLDDVEHRPWPLPDEPWAQAQTWEELLFAHWRVEPELLARGLPDGLELDTHDGEAWLGITPFRLTNLRLRGLPPLPRLSTFPEVNVRTYVVRDGRPGIWFLSLDAASAVAVEAAKRTYRLPYRRAQMRAERHGLFLQFDSARPGAAFTARYRGHGDLFRAEPGSLEHFLTERYCLYTADGGRTYRADIHHPPWPLQRGEATIALSTLAPFALEGEPHLLYAPRQDVVVWPLQELR